MPSEALHRMVYRAKHPGLIERTDSAEEVLQGCSRRR
jgi:hypothetical protein